ncbi:hypothetical protein SCUCBS95973_005002 [Sporothrix curviconia]|uniref:Uncharacterized protein n=1 Tax=Sporothrix curviconia TaxID=1260050 RepID=A0ABP0BTD0_9PEZI
MPYLGDIYDPEYVEDAIPALFTFSVDALEVMADRCPHLEEMYVDVQRTRGDRREMAMYRALSKLPRLKRVVLRLSCSLGSDAALGGMTPKDIKKLFEQAFSNCALDETLARAIFDVVSRAGQGSVQYLRIESSFTCPRQNLHRSFDAAVRVLTRKWVCQRACASKLNGVVVREIDANGTQLAIKQCSEDDWVNPWYRRTQNYEAVFKSLWPGNDPPWTDWTSLALETGDGPESGIVD